MRQPELSQTRALTSWSCRPLAPPTLVSKSIPGANTDAKSGSPTGSQALTDGLVKGVRWLFPHPYQQSTHDFHILEGLPVAAIVSSGFLVRYNVFAEYDEWMDGRGPIRFVTSRFPSTGST